MLKLDLAAVQRRDPGEDLDGREDGDEHREHAEDAGVELADAGHEHVVAPGAESRRTAMPSEEKAMAVYEAGRRCAKVGTTSLMTPIAGRIMM